MHTQDYVLSLEEKTRMDIAVGVVDIEALFNAIEWL